MDNKNGQSAAEYVFVKPIKAILTKYANMGVYVKQGFLKDLQ